ncbi:carotenoid oxygenase family protein [Microbulbifer agarilyticus]|uniref:carotenoid oxygenase family protein n=1 Tax=Microbulbifer agarilyticus TaxID=260552 RepID=UPI001C98B24A|nr:carotenoid oxygenase family protein [Microbulbifer agarilyticus]MBY6211198.1 carotenoid oxygenase family protein [Microbulbifer agarilyticus]
MDLSISPYLQGNYAPVTEEKDFGPDELKVEGQIPKNLLGAFMRDGPNAAFQPNHYVYPLDGDGMIHAVYLQDGKATYKNRWVETSHLQTERQFNRTLYGSVGKMLPVPEEVIEAGGEPNPVRNTANTNILYHGGKLLAMWEGGFPHLLNSDLSTVGLYDYDGALQPGDALTAHPKICPATGDLISCTQRWDSANYWVQIFDKNAQHKKTIEVPFTRKGIIHDLQITENYVVIFYAPAFHDMARAMRGEDPFSWEPEKGTKIFVIPRNGSDDIVTYETEAFFSWHFCNGFEKGGKIIIDYVWINSMPFTQTQGTGVEKQPRRMYRMELDTKTRSVTNEQFSDVFCEFSRVDERRMGKSYRYGFAASSNRSWGDAHGYNCTGRYDFNTGETVLHEYGSEANAGEPVYVANPDSENERDGWLMCFVYNPGEGQFLSILPAGDFSSGPVAKIHIPSRVPNGFHANWMQGLTL